MAQNRKVDELIVKILKEQERQRKIYGRTSHFKLMDTSLYPVR